MLVPNHPLSRSLTGPWWPLVLLLAFYLAGQVWWFLVVPLGQAPDESDHTDFVNYLLEERRLPRLGETHLFHGTVETRWSVGRAGSFQYDSDQTDLRWARGERNLRAMPPEQAWSPSPRWLNAEAGQPPLSYGVAATLLRPVAGRLSPIGRWQVIRIASIAAGLGAVLAGYYLGCWIWRRRNPALGGLALGTWMAALPMAGFSRSTASNDPLQACLGAWLFYLLVVHRWRSGTTALAAGCLTGLSLLTKASSLALLPGVAVWGLARGARDRLSRRLRATAAALGVSGLLLGIYWLIATREGTWYYTSFVQKWFPPARTVPAPWTAVRRVLSELVLTVPQGFFGHFGWLNVPRSESSLWTTGIILAGAAAGGLLAVFGALRHQRRNHLSAVHPELKRALMLSAVLVATFGVMLTVAGYRNLMTVGTTTLQGRHLLFLQLPIGLLLIAGWARIAGQGAALVRKWQHRIQLPVPGASVSLAMASLLAGVMVLLNWEAIFRSVAQVAYGGLRPSLAAMVLGDPVFQKVCATLPPALKIPALWKGLYILDAALTVALPAAMARLFLRRDSGRERKRIGRSRHESEAGSGI